MRVVLSACCMAFLFTASAHAQSMIMDGPRHSYGTTQNTYYYPSPYSYPDVLSVPVDILPPGATTLIVGGRTFYYANGVFYQKSVRDQKYAVVPPPIGAVVSGIPERYQLLMLNGTAFYECDGVYYKRVLEGYKVIPPPVPIVMNVSLQGE